MLDIFIPPKFKGQGTEVFHIHFCTVSHSLLGLSKACLLTLYFSRHGNRDGISGKNKSKDILLMGCFPNGKQGLHARTEICTLQIVVLAAK